VKIVTITSNQVSPPLDNPDADQRPGSSDIEWAERAYHHQEREPSKERRRVRRSRRRLRNLIAALAIVFLTAGLVVVMRYEGSPPPVLSPTSSHVATTPHASIAPSPLTLTPPLLGPLATLPQVSLTPKR
jgi:hypothetical protein